ncbi:MAG: hypothetical protein JXB23_14790, partial [Candidatus Aminicenantes bacterium]|nr:hypothetical protein [Candidatus Aminicenantes bacterium]
KFKTGDKTMTKKETIDRLLQIKNEIYDLAHEARHILNECGNGLIAVRARAHWIGHILNALDSEYGPKLPALGINMADTINALSSLAEEDRIQADA